MRPVCSNSIQSSERHQQHFDLCEISRSIFRFSQKRLFKCCCPPGLHTPQTQDVLTNAAATTSRLTLQPRDVATLLHHHCGRPTHQEEKHHGVVEQNKLLTNHEALLSHVHTHTHTHTHTQLTKAHEDLETRDTQKHKSTKATKAAKAHQSTKACAPTLALARTLTHTLTDENDRR